VLDVCTICIKRNLESMTAFEMRADGGCGVGAQVGANKVRWWLG